MGETPAKRRMRSAPGLPIFGNCLSAARGFRTDRRLRAAGRSLPCCLRTRSAISFRRRALSSGTMPPGFSACANLAGAAARIFSGCVPICFVNANQPLLQAASLAGYPQCHQTRNKSGSVGQSGCFHRGTRPRPREVVPKSAASCGRQTHRSF